MGPRWFVRNKPNPQASTRLFCLHCAGGSASEFRTWPSQLPGTFELLAIQLPGREGRVKDAYIEKMEDLVDGVVEAMTPFLDKPYVVFGHSFGALCGFEVIREVRRRGLNQPLLFMPAGRRPPHLASKRPPIASLPMQEFVEELRKRYGERIEHVLQSADLKQVFVPQIRADFALSETYRFRSGQPLGCPIVAFAGCDENDLDADELNAWAAHTSGRFHSRRLAGNHFFIRESQASLIDSIRQETISIQLERQVSSHRPAM